MDKTSRPPSELSPFHNTFMALITVNVNLRGALDILNGGLEHSYDSTSYNQPHHMHAYLYEHIVQIREAANRAIGELPASVPPRGG